MPELCARSVSGLPSGPFCQMPQMTETSPADVVDVGGGGATERGSTRFANSYAPGPHDGSFSESWKTNP